MSSIFKTVVFVCDGVLLVDSPQGLLHLIQKGIVPSYVDLTPALGQQNFPLKFEPSRFYHPDELRMRRDTAAAPAHNSYNIRFDMEALQQRVRVCR